MKFVDTRPSLLARVRDVGDRKAWEEFVNLYAPMVYTYAVQHGLQDADAADLTQDAMFGLMRSLRTFEYDPQRGTFRGWLVTVLRNHLSKHFEKHSRQHQGSGDTATLDLLNQLPMDTLDEAWEAQCKLSEFHWAADRIRHEFQGSTWSAFWLTTVEGLEIGQVARQLGKSAGAVYVARSRVLARIREEILKTENEWFTR
ncbi:MAG: sigma-70 family RNA polymerase sigma factor [Planctomycetales bacterium]|nr:sigma-70 family RNA polymerase sigma factor [Planctomycetales bacterium]